MAEAKIQNNVPDNEQVICITKSVKVEGEEQIQLDVEALKTVLTQKDVADLPVAIYSVAGPLRTGKSFLLTLLMRHIIQSKSPESELPRNDKEMLKNWFSWKGGVAPCTRGIYLLKHAFLVDIDVKTHRKAALFLMDTQGIFDLKTAANEHQIIGALSFLMSSRQFFNLNRSIESPHFDHIYKFAKLAEEIRKEDKDCAPVQSHSLTVIIRDGDMEDYSFGFGGGKEYLKERLSEDDDVAVEHEMMNIHFKKTFGEIPCFLLPPPAAKIQRMGKIWKPCLIKDIGKEFMKKLKELFQHMLQPLSLKEISGREITCSQLFEYMDMYSALLNTREDLQGYVPHVILMDQVTAMKQSIDGLTCKFAKHLWKMISEHSLNATKDQEIFRKERVRVMEKFDASKKIDIPRFVSKFRKGLEEMLKRIFEAYQDGRKAEQALSKMLIDFEELVKEKLSEEEIQKKVDKEIEKLKSTIHPSMLEKCCTYFTNEANQKLNKKIQSTSDSLKTIGLVAMAVGTGVAVVACPFALFAAAGGALELAGIAGATAGTVYNAIGLGTYMAAQKKENVVKLMLNFKDQKVIDEKILFSYSFELSIPLYFGLVDYPKITVKF